VSGAVASFRLPDVFRNSLGGSGSVSSAVSPEPDSTAARLLARRLPYAGVVWDTAHMARRGVRGGVEDRWYKTVRRDDGSTARARSAKYGVPARYRARYVDGDGEEREKVFAVKREAEAWLRERLGEVTAGTHIDPRAGRVTVGEVHTRWSAGQAHIARKTAATRRTAWAVHVQPRWGRAAVAEVKASAVRAWVAKMVKDGTGVPTIENAYGVLRMVCAAAVEDGCIPRNPCDGVKLPKREHADRGYLTHGQVRAAATACGEDGDVVRFLAYTGLRWGEMAALRVQDFDMLRRRVNVSRSVTESAGLDWRQPKTYERRSVPFPASIAAELAARMEGKGRDALVFTDSRGNVLRNSNWRARVFGPAVVACQAADNTFPDITPHDLRHTAASLAVSAGANVKAVQRMLGHARASLTLDTYADLFDSDLDAVAGALDAAIIADSEAVAGFLRDSGTGGQNRVNEKTPD
jgi:integrase